MVYQNNNNDEHEVIMDDTDTDDLEIDEVEGNLADKLKVLRNKLKACDEEKRNYLEDLQRTKADFLNSKRRLEEQLRIDKERAKDKILIELLTLVDSFDTAMADKKVWESIDENWRKGVEAIESKLASILTTNNVVMINPEGQKFNPEEHEAVSNSIVEDDADVDVVLVVLQKGFRRGDTIIRPARVVVGTK